MRENDIIAFLLEKAGPAIQYQLRRDILGESTESPLMQQMQQEILDRTEVKNVFARKCDDGWIGTELHGKRGMDSAVEILLRNGVEQANPVFADLEEVLCFSKNENGYKRTFHGGTALDEDGRGGNDAVVSCLLAAMGKRDNPLVQKQVELSLAHFRNAIQCQSLDSFSMLTRNKSIRFYKTKALFPGANHLYMLCMCDDWRTEENLQMIKASLAHCIDLMKNEMKPVLFRNKTHFNAPFNIPWRLFYFKIDKSDVGPEGLVSWLQLLARLAEGEFMMEIPRVHEQYIYLRELLYSDRIFTSPSPTQLKYFKRNMALEDRWNTDDKILCDLYFVGLKILHRAGLVSLNEFQTA